MSKIVSVRSELAVLRGMCHRDKRIAGTLLGSIDEGYFYTPESVEIYNTVMRQFAETGESPSYRLVLEDPDLSEDARAHYRDSEISIRNIQDAQKAIRILNKYRQKRGLYNLAAYIGQEMKKSRTNVDDLLHEVSNSVAKIQRTKSNKNCFEHFGKNNSSLQGVKDLLYGDMSEDVIPTGIPEFDEESGGFSRGSLVTLGATSGGGKSLAANDIAIRMANMGYKVLIVPLEMSKREMRARIMAKLAQVDVTNILHQKLSTDEKDFVFGKYKRWVLKTKRKGGRVTVFKPDTDMTIEEIMAASMAYSVDVVIIDYISLLKGVDGDDQWIALGAVARYAKINAENTNRVSVLLCQVSEEGKVRYAKAISEHSTNSWIWKTSKEEREKEVGVIPVEQPKSRNSRSFVMKLGFKWSTMSIVKLDKASLDDDVPDLPPKKKLRNLTSPDV